ncbi:DNA-directed DNA polymerase [Synchytrium microbalum]|uniref:DNA polymerase epsilon catalytic subunit n=1 Tax=Synchytrium microbalum TaxID=1806994 RepID=A0A507C7T4_9FUNG|nr:DNA-directed DNA polymerase [Synchytrium microbalum]TPX34056.1 DNA-directed DNA polymerase [Synchytrium microbalum]
MSFKQIGNPQERGSFFKPNTALPTYKAPPIPVEGGYENEIAPIQEQYYQMEEMADRSQLMFEEIQLRDEMDERMGFYRYAEGPEKLGWLVNLHPTLVKDQESPTGKSAIDLYFLEEDGGSFKSTVLHEPYFFIKCKTDTEADVEDYLRRKFEGVLLRVERVEKEDLDLANHLLGHKSLYLKLTFWNTFNLMACRKHLMSAYERNKLNPETQESEDIFNDRPKNPIKSSHNTVDNIIDIREFDLPYYVRTAIDTDIRVGLWYTVRALAGTIFIEPRSDRVKRAEPVVLAFDIETSKQPLKFPDAQMDSIMMISYMVDGQGFLITNREIVSEDIEDFEYTPTPEYEGPFTIFNEPTERDVLTRFFEHIQQVKPHVFVTYNGDSFDWPFIKTRALIHGIDMKKEIGFDCDTPSPRNAQSQSDSQGQFQSHHASHMDCFLWVKRDSYLPQGSQGLKAVTTAKLGYNPMELDPEDMTRFASEHPQTLAQYSVSDAVATYYLYMKYVNPFIFSLCNLIPMNPDEVLRRGSGTLCETLLMVQAYKANVIMPNKHQDDFGKFHDGHLLESETYVGGHVEALEAGVFRSDLPTSFHLHAEAYDQLISELDQALQFTLRVEGKTNVEDVVNYEEVKQNILTQLIDLRSKPIRTEKPLIYHLDVAAMYPNIILTNRLQPDALVDESTCASCDFNEGPGSLCQRRMDWTWRGEFFPAKRGEYNMIVNQLQTEKIVTHPGQEARPFSELKVYEQNVAIKKRLTEYSKRVYKKGMEKETADKTSIVCQRENPFYVNTVRQFRDRRYEYKGLLKVWKKKLEDILQDGSLAAAEEAKKMIVVYDSLQTAHKCILNSFYGYVMRRGARWYSMEMAGIVCLTGARIIQLARSRIEKLGRPLELDTDGIWCMLPLSFPENFSFQLKNGKSHNISYPGVMLNHLVHDKFTNHQYQELVNNESLEYSIRSENSVFFEVDGPYRAMVLPASTEEDRLLKKRYAVFNDDGTLAELKGFEVKRRGELKLVKIFQSQIFAVFLRGTTLEECYQEVAQVADRWLDVLYSKGGDLDDEELFDLISENRSMSKSLREYGAQKSTSISTAKRLAEFLGQQMVKDKGLNISEIERLISSSFVDCKFVITSRPAGLPVSERAIPVAIFSAELSVKKHFLRKWLRDPNLKDFDFRGILDWNYYLERFGSVIQKIITIPAAMQHLPNPIPRVRHPDWLHKRVAARDDKVKQFRITEMFGKANTLEEAYGVDMEDMAAPSGNKVFNPVVHKYKSKQYDKDIPEDSNPQPPPNMGTDYVGWLKHQKRKWARQIKERAHERSLIERGLAQPRREQLINVEGYFRQRTDALLNARLQVLQIAETDLPGEFRMWVLVKGDLHSIRLTVPRVFYLNCRFDQPDIARPGVVVEKRVRTLPRSHVCHHLYEFTMAESFYQENMSTFANVFTHESVDSVYETQVPLLFRALIQVGCFTAVKKERIKSGRGLDDGFDVLTDLTQEKNDGYLDRSNLNFLYLYHANTGPRHVFGLFSTASNKATVVLVDPANNKDAIPNLARFYSETLANHTVSQDPQFLRHEGLDCTALVVSTEAQAKQQISAAISAYQDARRGATMVIVQSPKSLRQVTDGIPPISEFPNAIMQSHTRDHSIPPLDWQRPACRKMMGHLMNVDGWVADRTAICRFANVPFCNVEPDYSVFLTDLILARRLQRKDMILWVSLARKPDLGGREQDYNADELTESAVLEVNVPGAYDSVCVEVEVFHLAKNTLLQTVAMADGDLGFDSNIGTSVEEQLQNGLTRSITDESLLSGRVVEEVKGLVQEWSHRSKRGDRWAALVLDQLPRWLSNPEAKLYDPALQALIHGMMRKSYSSIVADFKRLGSRVVYASFEKLILATTKHKIPQARAYIDYTIGALSKSFQHLTLVPVQYYQSLMWMDLYNWAGAITAIRQDERSIEAGDHAPGNGLESGNNGADETCNEVSNGNGNNDINTGNDSDTRNDATDQDEADTRDDATETGNDAMAIARENPKEKSEMRKLFSFARDENMSESGSDDDDNEEVQEDEADDEPNFEEIPEPRQSSNKRKEKPATTNSQAPESALEIEARWNIQEYLPTALQEHFQRAIGHYVYASTQYRKGLYDADPLLGHRAAKRVKLDDDAKQPRVGGMVGLGQRPGQSSRLDDDEDENDDMARFLRNFISMTLKRELIQAVPELQREYHSARMSGDADLVASWEFPILPGSHIELKKPLLEFIKSVCAVLSLEPVIEREVRHLRRDLLTLVGEREFADSSNFINPCEAFRLPGVMCYYCCSTRNLDLTRDPDLLPIVADDGRITRDQWLCPHCRAEYDKASIEQQLVDIVQRRLTFWQLQDLKCTKCRQIKGSNMRRYCACSGEFVTVYSKEDFRRRMHVFSNIAKFHRMDFLDNVVTWCMSHV